MDDSRFAKVSLHDVADDAVEDGFSGRWEARRWRTPLETEQTGLTHYRLLPGKRSPISHRHQRAEEVYVVLKGSGWIRLDETMVELRELDAVRVDAELWRALEAGPDGLEILVTGPYVADDGERRDDPWVDEDAEDA